jgi:hypothetical protein
MRAFKINNLKGEQSFQAQIAVGDVSTMISPQR